MAGPDAGRNGNWRLDPDFEKGLDALASKLAFIIRNQRLDTYKKRFLEGESAMAIYDKGAAVNDRVQAEIDQVGDYARNFSADTARRVTAFVENAVIVSGGILGYLGSETMVRKSDTTDDTKRKVDGWGSWKGRREAAAGSTFFLQSATFDLNSSARGAFQKLSSSIEKVLAGTLNSLRFAELPHEQYGMEVRGGAELLPHFQLIVSARRAREWKQAFEADSLDMLAAFPLQIELLQQLRAQARLLASYVRELKAEEVPTDKKEKKAWERTRFTRGYAPVLADPKKQAYLRRTLVSIYDNCVLVFDQALMERIQLLEEARASGSEAVRAMLDAYVPDSQHAEFMRLFEKQITGSDGSSSVRVRGASALKALLATVPPARYKDPKTRQWVPSYPARFRKEK